MSGSGELDPSSSVELRNTVLRLHSPGDLRLTDEAMPAPTSGEVLLRVTSVGLCGSDLHWFSEGSIGDVRAAGPLVVGHEFAGVIESGPRRGQRVAADPAIPCGGCELCREGHPNLCEEVRFAGYASTDGALRGYMAWPRRTSIPFPRRSPTLMGRSWSHSAWRCTASTWDICGRA